MLVFMLTTSLSYLSPAVYFDVWDYSSALSIMVINVLGLMWCFARNGGRNGREFISRFLAVAWVVVIRFGALAFAALFVQLALASRFEAISAESSWWDFVQFSVIEAAIYLRVGVHLSRIRRGRDERVAIRTSDAAVK